MKLNVGSIDRAARALIGLVLIGLASSGVVADVVMWVVGGVGVVLLATAAISFCPIWALLGINTRPKGEA